MDTIDPVIIGRRRAQDGDDDRPLMTSRHVCERFGVTPRTLHRWDRDPELGFPKPIVINGRKYWRRRDIEDFELLRSAGSKHEAA
jgi:MerR HTH family regulatory protein